MMSKKWTFSLTSLIIIFALAFVAPTAMGAVLGKDFKTTITINTGSGGSTLVGNNVITVAAVSLRVVFDKPVLATDFVVADDVTIFAYNKRSNAAIDGTGATIAPVPAGATSTKEFLITITGVTATDAENPAAVVVTIPKGAVTNNDPADVVKMNTGDDTLGKNAKGTLTFDVVATAIPTGTPTVVTIQDLPTIVLGPGTHDAFSFTVVLSEKAKEFKKDHIDLANATIDSDPVYAGAIAPITLPGANTPAATTGPDSMHHRYLVTIMPKYESKDDIVIKIKEFEEAMSSGATGETGTLALKKSVLSMPYMVKVNSDANKKVGQSGTEKNLPKDVVVPANGYLVVTKTGDSQVRGPGDAKHGSADIARRVNAKDQTYNLTTLDLGVNLEGFLIRGGTIDIVSPNAGLVISEIMWATDAGDAKRQWIEIANTTAADIKFGDKTHKIKYYEANEVLPDVSTVVDRVSTLYKGTNIWSIAGKGQPGRTEGKIVEERKAGSDATANIAIDIEIVPTDRLISMERAMAADGTYADGTMEGSWAQSMLPAQNFVDAAAGLFVGSPGASPINPVADPPPAPPEEPAPVIPPAMADDIKITEIMVDTGNNRLPQWIELTNVSGAEKSLAGWSVEISNSSADADVVAATVSLDLMGTIGVHPTSGIGQTVLLVAWGGRSSSNLSKLGDRLVNVSSQLNQKGRYTLLSPMGFMIELLPPQATGIVQFGDSAGNLGASPAWDIPMDDNGRSSLIRHAMLADGMMTMGTDANGWVLASSTGLVDTPATWYGSDEDAGTPGVVGGGPLPVELSHFRPARDKATGQVVITWATQSELNNAGFFIKRSQQRDGEFKVINATMVPGAGTTSEKQFYTYTDTTAQPNIVYYYQIEDVSLDGNRQTLTRGIRLKGHIGAAGKLTSTWGELKSSNE